jgi:hypothetical protein
MSVIYETNLLSLVSPWLDNNYQIQTKVLNTTTKIFIVTFSKHFWRRQQSQPSRLMSDINWGGIFLLTEAVTTTASQNLLTEASTLKTSTLDNID